MSTKQNYQINMFSGSLMPKMILFALPLIATGMLQLFYNAADIIIVGRYAGKEALSAVGSTGSLINLLINIFMGLSIGASVSISKFYGARDMDAISETLHTSVTVSFLSGIFVAIMGIVISPTLLTLMNTPPDVLDQSVLYMRIYFMGMPFNMVYTFCSAILRAVGDTRRPLYFLMISGVINVVLNLIFVIQFDMSVSGVALATIISQAVSMLLIIRYLRAYDGMLHLDFKQLRVTKDKFMLLIKIGLPAGIQGSLFSLSNVLIQSSINSFGSVAMAACAASANLESFVYTGMNAIHQTDITFASQNMGAKQYKRTDKVLLYCVFIVSFIGLAMGLSFVFFSEQLIGLYNSDSEVIRLGVKRIPYICIPYFVFGIMDVFVGHIRGLGYSIMPMIVSLCGVCLLRVVWIYTIFPFNPTLEMLYLSYPITWSLTLLAHIVCFMVVRKKIPKENEPLEE